MGMCTNELYTGCCMVSMLGLGRILIYIYIYICVYIYVYIYIFVRVQYLGHAIFSDNYNYNRS